MEDRRKLIAALVEKTGVKLDEKDPAFLLVELNLLMLQKAGGDVAAVLDESLVKFKKTAIASTDDLISVINETLALYKQRTQELQDAVRALQAIPPAPPAPPAPTTPPAKAITTGILFAGGLLTFALGFVSGLLVNLLA